MAKKVGRPSKFKKRYIEDMYEFFDVEPMRKEIMAETTKPNGEESKTYKYVPNYLPTLVRFAKHIGVAYWTVWNWEQRGSNEEYRDDMTKAERAELDNLKEFSKAYKTAKQMQEDFLIQGGLAGASNATAYIFTAKNLTSMRDKVESEVSYREVKPLLDNLRTKKLGGDEVKMIDGEEVTVKEHGV